MLAIDPEKRWSITQIRAELQKLAVVEVEEMKSAALARNGDMVQVSGGKNKKIH